ncbi:MAG: acyl-CoA dehydrogenase family protein [Myxococcota bacterium]|nr:acyl-CoA dehydrogenase family protein [Myxococcota bacterium]
MFIQDAPQVPDLFAVDGPLQAELRRRLPDGVLAEIAPELAEMGQDTTGPLQRWMRAAEAQPPEHVPYDPWGRRVDEIRLSPAWKSLQDYAATRGIVASGYREQHRPFHRIDQAARLYLFAANSAIFACPLAMTDAAARVLLDSAEAPLRERLFPRLTSQDPQEFITSGQWMTERSGGSDVGGTETIARPVPGEEGVFTLHGVKWFTSSTTSEMALTLARIDAGEGTVAGSRGLTVFAVEVTRDGAGALQGIQVNRLKDKLGTKALPTAELTLDGLRATQIGETGRGVATISTMLNITRYYNAVSSASAMAKAVWMAQDYAKRRVAFGKPIAQQPLHQHTLNCLEAELHGGLALCMEVAQLLGKQEAGQASEAEQQRLRALVPLAKLTLGKQSVSVVSEALECFGGAGYVEDTGLPGMLRDAQVFPIWEGTTNVLSLDLLRAEARGGAFSALLADLSARAADLSARLDPRAKQALVDAIERVGKTAATLVSGGDKAGLERYARRLALTTGYAAEALFVGETAAGDVESIDRFQLLVEQRLMAPLA